MPVEGGPADHFRYTRVQVKPHRHVGISHRTGGLLEQIGQTTEPRVARTLFDTQVQRAVARTSGNELHRRPGASVDEKNFRVLKAQGINQDKRHGRGG